MTMPTDEELLHRVVKSLKTGVSARRRKIVRWSLVSDRFLLGSTYSRDLCVRFGFDPEELV